MPRMPFPEGDELRSCGDWCRPIHMVEAAIGGQPFAKYFRVDDFMVMGKLHRRGRQDLILYKHCLTRGYLNLDGAGHAYRYLSSPSSLSAGQYRIHTDLVQAIDALWLHEMPWLFGSGFDHETGGLSFDERWGHPDVQAWCARRAAAHGRRARPPR